MPIVYIYLLSSPDLPVPYCLLSNKMNELSLIIHHHGTPHALTLAADATLQDLTSSTADILHIPPENQKLLISPKPGMQKAPFPPTRLTEVLPLDSPRLKITVFGTPTQEINDLNAEGESTKRKYEARAASHAAARASPHAQPYKTAAGGVHTLSSSSISYTFHRLLPLSYLPNPSRSLDFLTRLRDDPGIKAAMAKHKFSVAVLTEMDPVMHTTMESRTLGLNRNKGEAIELRLRTDAYDGYRDYRTIRKTLCHELAHCVFSEHDRAFWDLTNQIEKEVEVADWKRGGTRLTGMDFYNPGDWERERDETIVDEKGWTGGEFVLGAGSGGGGTGHGESRRELLAKAAEERLKQQQKKT